MKLKLTKDVFELLGWAVNSKLEINAKVNPKRLKQLVHISPIA